MEGRWWYLRRAIPWGALLGCCATALVVAGLLALWPSSAIVTLPAMLACCAAAAGFVFDEVAAAVVAVTPRGAGWRRTARLGVVLLPLAVWTGLVLARPGDLPLARAAWWLAGAAAMLLAAGLAALASRREVAAPGSQLAALVALAAISPVVVTSFLGWSTVYPVGDFGDGARGFWLVVAGCGGVLCVAALRPGIRR